MAAPSIERSKLAIIFRTLPVLVALVSASVVTAPAQEVVFSSSFEASEGPGPGCIASNQICNVNDSAPSLAHSLVEDGLSSGTIDSGGNLFTDPGLGDPDGADNIPGSLDDDLRPAAESPVVDAGSVEHLPPDTFDLDDDGNTAEPVPFDIAGDGRALGPEARPDMGAYESSAEAAQAASQLTRLTAQAAAQQIHYVRPGDAGSGSSWADAYGFLQDALAAAQAGDQIWVAAGVYRPDQGAGLTPGDRALSFQLPAGVRLHGGFAGTESSLAERDLATQRTILSGDLAADDDGLSLHEDNSRHVVRIVLGDDGTLLDGVTVTGGNADGAEDDGLGGGVFVKGGTPWLVNVHVTGSMAECGGGIALTAGATAHLINTVINGNQAETGGGVCNIGSSPSITHATITFNTAATAPGIHNDNASPAIANSIVSGNRVFDDLDRCEALQYPCSLADVPEDVLAASLAVMQGAWAARDSGTMLDALVYLENHPDVVEAIGDSRLVGARLRGGSFDFLVEAPSWIETSAPAVSVNASTVTMDSSQIREEAPIASPLAAAANRDIVGEDRDGDGKIDNRDGKRALVIDSWNTGDALAAALSLAQTRDYRGRIDVEDGKELDDYRSWHDYDFVYLSTQAYTILFNSQAVPRDIRDIITLIEMPIPLEEPALPIPPGNAGFQHRLWWYEQWGVILDDINGRAALSPHFFRKTYNGSLDNAIVYCAGCDVVTGQWVRTLGTSNFGLFGWDGGDVDLAEAAPYNSEVVADLATGLNLEWATPNDYGALEGRMAAAPSSDAEFMRLIELPLLLYPDSSTVLREGADLTYSVIGTVGDNDPDQLELRLLHQGVVQKVIRSEAVRYVVDGHAVPGTFDLIGGEYLGSNATVITHNLDLGFPLRRGILPIEVIAQVLPDSSESRFSVNAVVDAFDCSASATISGFRDGAFSGPAVFVRGADTGLTLTIKSLEWAIGYDPDDDGVIENAYEATFYLPPELVPASPELPWKIPLGNELISLVYSYDLSDPWFFGTDHTTGGCAECGGTLTVTDIAPDNSIMVGEIDFTGMEGFYDAPDISHFKAKFRAASNGSEWGGETPYDRCIQQYYQLD